MILFADSGSTKCDWVLVTEKGQPIHKIKTDGINPILLSDNAIQNIVEKADLILQKRHLINEVHFYGAGCGEAETKKRIRLVLQTVFKDAKFIAVEEDIIGAVKATTNKPSIVCILGTGTNCCYFDGKKVIQKFPALGYLLADEGSGNYFGKKLLKDYFLGRMPMDLTILFKSDYKIELDHLLNKLYSIDNPSKYLASFAQFLFKNRENAYIEDILYEGISKFINTYIFQYKEEVSKYPIHFVGSVAYYSQDIVKKLLNDKGYQVKSFVKKPIDHLVIRTIKDRTLQKLS
ncbi:N-acetylglucosamine kinase [Aquimarina muelleri]|uniref:N-acetylglucosamine kinase n=1 Tax=Aquimarina muelleri TaxID=279356 RepID=A0A918JUU2_9FLAO|nr:N-acetylglucosamine kinase [Aquimarina muelleri]MCX2762238.1 N-acetylglucosamine kinase [Aquimarina muelleri]GGX18162.1 hypothetical protein GCM10007384_19560 [Aquimarina muelleri]